MSGGFAIPDITAYIQFYSLESGRWSLQGEVGPEFEGRAFSVASLHSPRAGEVWYLVWGRRIGDTAARLRVHLYSFDGRTVKKIWERDGLRGGAVRVSEDRIILDYDVPFEGGRLPPTPKVEVLRPTVNGLEP